MLPTRIGLALRSRARYHHGDKTCALRHKDPSSVSVLGNNCVARQQHGQLLSITPYLEWNLQTDDLIAGFGL
ncbi:hypothetical protein KUCAC02_029509 [Chaenocephalus aceratus]|nr:hypothetical protein KUCAC02_029509 [Chaenocephalus aceratus]